MRIFLNGEEREVAEPLTLASLVEQMSIQGRVAIELNREVVRRALHTEVVLKEGDRVEVVTFVGGG
jgi:thiamine biosynthesis protein ThiS